MNQTLPLTNFYTYISDLVKKDPSRLMLQKIDKEGIVVSTFTRHELLEAVEKTAAWLGQAGIKEGDVIALAMSNSPELLFISWAAWASGIVTAPLDIKRDTMEDHLYKIDLAGVKLVISESGQFTEDEKKKFPVPIVELPSLDSLSSQQTIVWKEGLDHLSLILFTSGTTARPKGVQLSLLNLIANADGIREWFKITAEDRFLVVLPLHHINSTTFCLATLLGEGSIATLSLYSNSQFWLQAKNAAATFTSIVPSICFDQLSRVKEYEEVKKDLKLSRIQIGSAPVVVSDLKSFIDLFHIPLYQGYGQTETALRVTGVPMNLSEKLYAELIETNCIGKEMKWADVEIMDSGGELMKEGEEGELVVKGPIVTKGYLGLSEGFKNGYFLTGDIGYFKVIDGVRYFYLQGRKKEIIIKGGINISPVAVEDKLKQLSSDIEQVYVVGVSDKRYGEEVAAVICWKEKDHAVAELRLQIALLDGTPLISAYETPQYITSINSQDLPMTSTGKVQRSVIASTIPYEQYKSIYDVFQNESYVFQILSVNSPYIKKAFDLYNYSWSPLTISLDTFRDHIKYMKVIMCIDREDNVVGLVEALRTNLTQEQLLHISYDELLNVKKTADKKGISFICVAICGPNYKPEKIPEVSTIPASQEVMTYLNAGYDSVYNFHLKKKGGLDSGGHLVKLLPHARPDDKMSLGYNMLLAYPELDRQTTINSDASVPTQLIECVMYLGAASGVKNVYAFSRPSGLAKYLSENH